MAMWMPYRIVSHQYLVLMLVFSLVCGGKLPYCSPPGKQMLLRGRCVDCPQCVPGQFLNKRKEITVDKMFGSMECYPCQNCPAGTYSNDRKWNEFDGYKCYIHRNCERRGRVVKTPGTNITNTICGECLKGYISGDYPYMDKNSYCYPCSAKDKDIEECQGFISPVITPGIAAPVISGDPVNPGHPMNSDEPVKPVEPDLSNSAPESLSGTVWYFVVIGVPVAALILIVVIIVAVCCQQKSRDKKATQENEMGLLNDVLDVDGPKVFSSVSTGVSQSTGVSMSTGVSESTVISESSVESLSTPLKDVPAARKLLTQEEMQTASSIRLKNDDSYIRAVGNADPRPRKRLEDFRGLLISLGLKQEQVDELLHDYHPIYYLNKFVQCKGKGATLLCLYNGLETHQLEAELDALIKEFRKNADTVVDSDVKF